MRPYETSQDTNHQTNQFGALLRVEENPEGIRQR